MLDPVQRRKSICYCINLRRAAGAVSALYDRYLEPAGVSVTQFSLLLNIGRQEVCSVSDLAAFTGLDRTTLVRTLKPLLDQKLVQDLAQPGTRNRRLTLTASGRDTVERCDVLWEKAQKTIEEQIGRDQVQNLLDILYRLESI